MKGIGKFGVRSGTERGFTLVEMLIAVVIVVVGLVAVAQLVPVSVQMNSNNRNDGTALVFAQQELETLREQPLTSLTFTDPAGVTCPIGNTCNLGDPTQANLCVGNCPLAIGGSGAPMINFSATTAAGYSFLYTDPNDPFSAPYDVRWAVYTAVNPISKVTTSRRIIVGVYRRGMKTVSLPITLDTMVEK